MFREAFADDQDFQDLTDRLARFEGRKGRRAKILIVKMGQDGHDRGGKMIAGAFADMGFDVQMGDLFQTPQEAAALAVELGVDAIGVSTQAAGHKTLVPGLMEALDAAKATQIEVICGGVIPAQDYDFYVNEGFAPSLALDHLS